MERTDKHKEFSKLRNFNLRQEVINFATTNVSKIMFDLGVKNWGIGGSVGAIIYGCDIKRIPHDIDVIVSEDEYINVLNAVKNDFRYKEDYLTSSCDDEFNTFHFAFRSATGPAIDIIANRVEEFRVRNYGSFNVVDFSSLYEAKKLYHRPKDIEDLKEYDVVLESLRPK